MKDFKGFKKGVDLGGWLSQCDHTKERYDTFITEDDFKTVSERGFDHVRIPVDYELILSDSTEFKDVAPVIGYGHNLVLGHEYYFNEEGFKYIDFAIEMCKKYNLHMILDLHRTPGYSVIDTEYNCYVGGYNCVFYNIWSLEDVEKFLKDEYLANGLVF